MRYRLIAAAAASECGQWHVVSVRRLLTAVHRLVIVIIMTSGCAVNEEAAASVCSVCVETSSSVVGHWAETYADRIVVAGVESAPPSCRSRATTTVWLCSERAASARARWFCASSAARSETRTSRPSRTPTDRSSAATNRSVPSGMFQFKHYPTTILRGLIP